MRRKLILLVLLIINLAGCNLTPSTSPTLAPSATNTSALAASFTPAPPAVTQTISIPSTEYFTETPSASDTPTSLPSDTPLPSVESLKAIVTAEHLSCRYGPGSEYLYLFAFRATAKIKLIGRVDAQNWDWVLVENQVPCWVKASFLDIEGNILNLPVVYPGVAKLPITPYWPKTQVLSAKRDDQTNKISISWVEVPISIGHYEDENMHPYVIELWRCQDGELIFDSLGTTLTYISFVDEPGCSQASHGRVWVQDKHGYAGPAEIPWPEIP